MSEKRILTAEDIAAVSDNLVEEMDVPEWGGSVFVRLLPAIAGLALSEAVHALPEGQASKALLLTVAAVLANPDGSPLFTDMEKAIEILGKRQVEPLARIQERAGAIRRRVEEAAKNASGEVTASVASPTV